jgi:hypothetical protein
VSHCADLAAPARLGWLASSLIALAACGFPKPSDVAECTGATDCKSPNAPFCVAGSCVAACHANHDCVGSADTPFCQTASGKCVACVDASSCSADKPVCDATLNVCRGCDRDDQCPSGVCVDSEGRCAMASELVFVSPVGTDNATCSVDAPCRTFTAAFAATTGQRFIIHIIGSAYHMTTGVAPQGNQFVIDGSDTVISCDHGAAFSATQRGETIAFSRVTINASEGTAVSVSNGGAILLYGVTLGAFAQVSGSSLSILNSTVQDVECSSAGVLDIEHSTAGQTSSNSCGVTVLASRLSGHLSVVGGKVIIENNLFTSLSEVQDAVGISGSVSGSRFAFNTLVNFSGIDDTANVISCNPGVDVSSNIFAWHSSAQQGVAGCAIHDSLFDTFVPANLVGENRQADAATFFVDLNGRDLHLAPASPARRIGQPGIVDVDIDGALRPQPAGTRPDVGAYEAP